MVSGFGVFVTLFGGLRYAKHLAQLRPSFRLSQAEHHVEMAQKRAQYAHLDQASTTDKFSSKIPAQEPTTETSDTMMQIQFLFCSVISLWVATVVGNKYSDSHQKFNENLAVLPLQTGTTILCERYLCPKVLTHHKNLQLESMTYEMLHLSIEEDRRRKVRRLKSAEGEDGVPPEHSTSDNGENPDRELWRRFDEDPLVPTPNEIYNVANQNTSVTAELDSLQRLVYHCECREAFEKKCRRHGQALDPRTDLVNVPVSGVPLRFLTPTGESERNESETHSDNNWR